MAATSPTIAKKKKNSLRQSRHHSQKPKLVELIIPLLAIGGLYWFSASFFLAKRSLPQVSSCDEAPTLLRETLKLSEDQVQRILSTHTGSQGCWLPRRIDSMVILVVDALRFDFAQYHLPLSVGSRIGNTAGDKRHHRNVTTSSQLLQFVADPPTVTMQRLKGLTTGSLPTFADISGNMGGATIEEDSWVQQLKDTPFRRRGMSRASRLGFVGDDTWVDLFPTQFDDAFPLPSFNTRDLDTVDNGCLKELPGLLTKLRTSGQRPEELEVVVAHFLGVDHVGHTYGPHDQHMDAKLQQMDAALSTTLEVMDESDHCHLALIFGDHGMTEDGNHGGGTDDEINAALFVHFSPACGDMPVELAPHMGSKYIQDAFQSIHQIDLVPTLSILLGLPIPYANLGGIAPSLLGYEGVHDTAAALALNSAQVWRYLTVYSDTANKLPNLPELQDQLEEAVAAYQEALALPDANDSNAFYKACGLFKVFLVEAAELGHRVWTRFDTVGMILGGTVVFFTLIVWMASLYSEGGVDFQRLPPRSQVVEIGMSAIFCFFQSGMLSFSNSYIEAEQSIVVYMMGIIGTAIFVRMSTLKAGGNAAIVPWVPVLVPLLSRISESLVTGHGLDPSLRLYWAHSAAIFLPSLLALLTLRVYWFRILAAPTEGATGVFHVVVDCAAMILLALAWIEKRSVDQERNGYLWMRLTIALLLLCTPIAVYQAIVHRQTDSTSSTIHCPSIVARALAVLTKLLIMIMVVTGPATAATVLLVSLQGWMLYLLCSATGFYEVSAAVMAVFWRLLVRHTFFATNHGCAFNRLQYSAAFVATIEFDFALGGLQLFLNTFGWEVLGLAMVGLTSHVLQKPLLWKWYCFYQIMESFFNCISVSVLRRHLMVWAVYAPRFLFSSVFLVLNCLGQVVVYAFAVEPRSQHNLLQSLRSKYRYSYQMNNKRVVLGGGYKHLALFLIMCLTHTSALVSPVQVHPAQAHPVQAVTDIHTLYGLRKEGKYVSERVAVHVVVLEVKKASPRLTFLRVRDCTNSSIEGGSYEIELLLRERDTFLSQDEIANITTVAAQPGVTLHCRAFPERLSLFDGPSFFPHLPLPTAAIEQRGVCLHVVAANITLSTGELLQVCPIERPQPQPLQTIPATRAVKLGSMPTMMPTIKSRDRSRGGARNRDRGGIFTAWALQTFGAERIREGHGILDIAGGSGQLSFQLGIRRGFNITVVDPRELRLNRDERSTLQWQRETGLRLTPEGRNKSLPPGDYGHHFLEVINNTTKDSIDSTMAMNNSMDVAKSDRMWLVGGEAHVRHIPKWFDANFASDGVWRDCSVVLGMHPDEATEDIIDLALAHNKPFAVVPCCVFWKRDPHRITPGGKPVRTWEHFCQYLAAKNEHIQVASLPFPGRNIALYYLGEDGGENDVKPRTVIPQRHQVDFLPR